MMKKLLVLFTAAVVGGVAFAADWEITKEGTQAYISDGVWTFKAGLDNNRVRDVDGKVRAEGPYALTVGDCTVYPAAVTPLDFSKPLVDCTGIGREYAISAITFKFGTHNNGNGTARVYTATAAGLVAGKLTLPAVDHQFTIGEQAFCGCKQLDFDLAGLPEGLTSIARNAFADSGAYGKADCPNLATLGEFAFIRVAGITDLIAPVLTAFNGYTFTHSGITNIYLGAESPLAAVQGSAFNGATNLVSITPFLPKGCTKIGRSGFEGCVKLASPLVYCGGTNKQIPTGSDDWDIFHDCQSLPSVDLSHSTMKFLTRRAFYNCYALEWVKLPEDFESMGGTAGNQGEIFANCTNLTTITPFLPDTVTNLCCSAFQNCPKLRGRLKLKGVTHIYGSAASGSGIDFVEFGPKLELIDSQAFANCPNLTGISAPKKLRGVTVGSQIFHTSTNLTGELDLRFMTSVPGQCFRYANKVETLRFGDVSSVGQMAFLDMFGLRQIYWYGDKPATFGSSIFQSCTAGAITNYVPTVYKDNWQTAPGVSASPLGKTPVQWSSNTRQWIRTWNPGIGLMMIIK